MKIISIKNHSFLDFITVVAFALIQTTFGLRVRFKEILKSL